MRMRGDGSVLLGEYMADPEGTAAFKAVERVLTGAVSKILHKYGNKEGGQSMPRSTHARDSDSDDDHYSSVRNKRSKGWDMYLSTYYYKRNFKVQESVNVLAGTTNSGPLYPKAYETHADM